MSQQYRFIAQIWTNESSTMWFKPEKEVLKDCVYMCFTQYAMENRDKGDIATKLQFWPLMRGLLFEKEKKAKSGQRSIIVLTKEKIAKNFSAQVGLDPEELEKEL